MKVKAGIIFMEYLIWGVFISFGITLSCILYVIYIAMLSTLYIEKYAKELFINCLKNN